MRELSLDQKRILNFSEKYVEGLILKAKKRFGQVCNADKTLDREYCKYVSNPENINVTFRARYGRMLALSLSHVSVDYSFDYKDSYYATTGVSGDVKFDSYGDAHLSNVHTTSERRSYTANSKGSTYFSSTALTRCEMILGDMQTPDLSHYVDVTNSPISAIPRELVKLSSERITYDTVNKYISVGKLPQHVYEKMKEQAIGEKAAKNFEMTLTDYLIDEISVTYLPFAYELDIWVNYKGDTFSQKEISSIDCISAQGLKSEHFQHYQTLLEKEKIAYAPCHWPTGKVYVATMIYSVIFAIGLIVLLFSATAIGNIGFALMYKPIVISMIVFSFALAILTGVFWYKKWILVGLKYSVGQSYDPSKSVNKLIDEANQSFRKQKRKSVLFSIGCVVVVVIVSLIMCVISIKLYQKTNVEHFYYTPEIVRTYEGTAGDALETIEILSCDENGNVEVIHTSVYKGMTAKMKYIGQITKKDFEGTYVTLTFYEWIENPNEGSPDKTMYMYFYDNDYEKLVCEGNDYLAISQPNYDTSLPKADYSALIGCYSLYESGDVIVLQFESCAEDGNVTALYTLVNTEAKTIATQRLFGKISSDENHIITITFESNEWIINTANLNFTANSVATISDNFTVCNLFEEALSRNNNKVTIVKSSEDFIKIKNSSGRFVLANDIDFKGDEISPLGDFSGVLIGNGYKIKNYKINASDSDVGLFSTIKKSAILVNFGIEEATITVSGNRKNVGLLCGLCYGSISNITISGTVDAQNCEYVGGVAGRLISGSAENILVKESSLKGVEYVGGCFGNVYNSTITNLNINTEVTINCTGESCGTIYGSKEN